MCINIKLFGELINVFCQCSDLFLDETHTARIITCELYRSIVTAHRWDNRTIVIIDDAIDQPIDGTKFIVTSYLTGGMNCPSRCVRARVHRHVRTRTCMYTYMYMYIFTYICICICCTPYDPVFISTIRRIIMLLSEGAARGGEPPCPCTMVAHNPLIRWPYWVRTQSCVRRVTVRLRAWSCLTW